jgi:UDP-glucose:(heptosyl)LPS alpha-1,3-glucosyltransferase
VALHETASGGRGLRAAAPQERPVLEERLRRRVARHAPARRDRHAVVGRDRAQAGFVERAKAKGLDGRISFLGGKEDVRPYYAAADCLILPSRYDPFPNTALEALAMGLPVIVSSHCGAAEIVVPGASGWVCEPDDVLGVAQSMRAADEAIRTRDLTAAARAAAEGLGIDAMAQKLIALYASL